MSTKAGWALAGPVRRLRLAQVPAQQPRRVARAAAPDYVDIFYSHRVDPDTPLEETISALDTAVRPGKALYAGISSYSAERTERAIEIAKSLGTPLVIHQPSYSLVNRWVEDGLLDTLDEQRHGLDRLHPARAGPADRQVPRRPERRRTRPPRGSFNDSFLSRTTSSACAVSTTSRAPAARPSPSWPSPGCCARAASTSALIGVSSHRAARREPRRARQHVVHRRRARRDRRASLRAARTSTSGRSPPPS